MVRNALLTIFIGVVFITGVGLAIASRWAGSGRVGLQRAAGVLVVLSLAMMGMVAPFLR